jgi:hypothetical protein
MISKLTIHILVVSLLLYSSPNLLAQSETTPSDQLDNILQLHAMLDSDGAPKLLQSLGPAIASKSEQFMNDPANMGVMGSEQALELVNRHNKLNNYLVIKNIFDECKNDKSSKRKMNSRILDEAWRANSSLIVNCTPQSVGMSFADLRRFSGSVTSLMAGGVGYDQDEKNSLQERVALQALKNSALTYMSLAYRYEPAFLDESHPDVDDISKVTEAICQKSGKHLGCTPKQRKGITEFLNRSVNRIKSGGKATFRQAANDINRSLVKLNKKLEEIPLKSEGGYFKTPVWDTSDADLKDPETNRKFQEYVQEYLHQASHGSGLLMLTDSVRDRSGGLRQLEDGDMDEKTRYFGDTRFTFKKHRTVSAHYAKKAKREAQGKILKHSQAIHKLQKGGLGGDDLAKLVRTNPVAVGQVLINDPLSATLVCDSFMAIDRSDHSDATWDGVWMWGGAIVGGAVALTGVGAGIGAFIFSGTTAAATMGTVATAAYVAGAVTVTGEALFWSFRSDDHYSAISEFDASYLAGNSDEYGIVESREALTEFKEARMYAALSLGFAAMDIGLLKMMRSGGKVGSGAKTKNGMVAGRLTPNQLKVLSSIYQVITKPAIAQKILQTIGRMGRGGAAKMDRFITLLSEVSDKKRIQFLKRLDQSSMSPALLRRIANEALRASKSCT